MCCQMCNLCWVLSAACGVRCAICLLEEDHGWPWLAMAQRHGSIGGDDGQEVLVRKDRALRGGCGAQYYFHGRWSL